MLGFQGRVAISCGTAPTVILSQDKTAGPTTPRSWFQRVEDMHGAA
jgi:hypothetical protein